MPREAPGGWHTQPCMPLGSLTFQTMRDLSGGFYVDAHPHAHTTPAFTLLRPYPARSGLAGLRRPAAVPGAGSRGPVGAQHTVVERSTAGLRRSDSEFCGRSALGLRHGAKRAERPRAHTLLCMERDAIADGLACHAIAPCSRVGAAGRRLCSAPGARPSAGCAYLASCVVLAAAMAPHGHGLRVSGCRRVGRQPLTVQSPSKKPAEAGFFVSLSKTADQRKRDWGTVCRSPSRLLT